MTTREDFEAVFTSAKAYTNETTGDYLQPYLQAWQAWQAATTAALASAPSWHDAPTVPGLWMGWHNHVHQIEEGDLRKFSLNSGLRWFGPIPEDKP